MLFLGVFLFLLAYLSGRLAIEYIVWGTDLWEKILGFIAVPLFLVFLYWAIQVLMLVA